MVLLSVMSAQKERGRHSAGVGVRSGRGSLWPERLGDKAGDGRSAWLGWECRESGIGMRRTMDTGWPGSQPHQSFSWGKGRWSTVKDGTAISLW